MNYTLPILARLMYHRQSQMSETKSARTSQRQLGQFMTPSALAQSMVDSLTLTPTTRVLETSAGDGAFIIPLIRRFLALRQCSLDTVLTENIFAYEIDSALYQTMMDRIASEFGVTHTTQHNLICGDFFKSQSKYLYDIVIGNPPFGGTISSDHVENRFGMRNGLKIKKETYSFFTVASIELLTHTGQMLIVCSDTLLTISTMKGLREYMLFCGSVSIKNVEKRSFDGVNQPMIIVDFRRTPEHTLSVRGHNVTRAQIDSTGNKSWTITDEFAKYFDGEKIGDYMIATSGMTTGNNELFVREIDEHGCITEKYEFEFFNDPITLKKELERARNHELSEKVQTRIRLQEANGIVQRNVRIKERDVPLILDANHSDYAPYNKSSSEIVYAKKKFVIYWKNDGDAVYTFKKNGPWYLHGVGGKQFFGKQGITFGLVASRINARYLPRGYILDSGAPFVSMRDHVDSDKLYLILAWALSPMATKIMKTVINHTRNIQGKDFERLPYPFWVSSENQVFVIRTMKKLVDDIRNNKPLDETALQACLDATLMP